MAIAQSEKNKKLEAAPSGAPLAAVTALKRLKKKEKLILIFSSDDGPKLPTGGIRTHIQGMSSSHSRGGKRRHMYITTSASKGNIITARMTLDNLNYRVEKEPLRYENKTHPGGVQVIGHYLVIPIYFKQYTGIEIRDIDSDLKLVKQFRTERKPYCVGITTTRDNTGEYYVLAVVTHNKGKRVDIYRTPPNLKLSDPGCFFELRWTFNAPSKTQDRKLNWRGYANNISLLSDTSGNIYFLGLMNTNKLGVGDNIADLFLVDLKQPEEKLFSRHGSFRPGRDVEIGFRFGGGATVVSKDALEIYASDRNPQDKHTIKADVYAA